MKKQKFALLLAVLMIYDILASCASGSTATASTTGGTAGTTAASADNPYDKSDKIVLAVVSSMTGERAQNGIFAKEAMDMWADQVNDAGGGIIGKVEIVCKEDDQKPRIQCCQCLPESSGRGDINGVILSTFGAFTPRHRTLHQRIWCSYVHRRQQCEDSPTQK